MEHKFRIKAIAEWVNSEMQLMPHEDLVLTKTRPS